MNRLKTACDLFVEFFKVGCFSFGGGWTIIAQLQDVFIHKRHESTEEEMLDIASVSKSLPGQMVGNVAMLFGYRRAGYLGGLACVLGLSIPPIICLSVIACFYTALSGNPVFDAAMTGIRAAVVPICGVTAYTSMKSAFRFPVCYAVAIAALVIYFVTDANCVLIVLFGAVCGPIICKFCERDEET